eukprot:scaffold2858_cov659-Pavlova_lutheri.AAC.229
MDESGKRATVPEIRVPTSRRNVDETWASGFSFSFHSSERGRRGRELHSDCACRVRVWESTLGIARSDSPAIHDDGLRVGPHVDGPTLRVRDEGSDAVVSLGRPASTGIVLRIDLELHSTPTCGSASPTLFFLVISNPWWWTPGSWRVGRCLSTSPLPPSLPPSLWSLRPGGTRLPHTPRWTARSFRLYPPSVPVRSRVRTRTPPGLCSGLPGISPGRNGRPAPCP